MTGFKKKPETVPENEYRSTEVPAFGT